MTIPCRIYMQFRGWQKWQKISRYARSLHYFPRQKPPTVSTINVRGRRVRVATPKKPEGERERERESENPTVWSNSEFLPADAHDAFSPGCWAHIRLALESFTISPHAFARSRVYARTSTRIPVTPGCATYYTKKFQGVCVMFVKKWCQWWSTCTLVSRHSDSFITGLISRPPLHSPNRVTNFCVVCILFRWYAGVARFLTNTISRVATLQGLTRRVEFFLFLLRSCHVFFRFLSLHTMLIYYF